MSRAVKTDHEFNKKKFTELLRSAQGGRIQSEFANDCGLSLAYICKYLNGQFDKAPTPATIKKIAACAAGDVSIFDLLEAAGYDSQKYKTGMVDEASLKKKNKFEKLALATVTSMLSADGKEWTTVVPSKGLSYDFGIKANNNEYSSWLFVFIHDTDLVVNTSLNDIIGHYFTRLVFNHFPPKTKYTFVTDKKELFDKIKKYNPYMLAMIFSVMLIDTSSMTVITEEYLDSALSMST